MSGLAFDVKTQQTSPDTLTVTVTVKPIQTGVIVPLYVYPLAGAWDRVVQTKLAHPNVPVVAVINPDSGPGTSQNQDYVGGISYLQRNGVKALGYVHTSYGERLALEVESDIDKYLAWYPTLDGIFFDEVASTGSEAYLLDLGSYARGHGYKLTIGNPGVAVPPTYYGLMDNYVVYEGPESGLSPMKNTIKKGSSIVIHSAPTFNAQEVRYVGMFCELLYVTNRSDQGKYNTISPYLQQIADTLAPP